MIKTSKILFLLFCLGVTVARSEELATESVSDAVVPDMTPIDDRDSAFDSTDDQTAIENPTPEEIPAPDIDPDTDSTQNTNE